MSAAADIAAAILAERGEPVTYTAADAGPVTLTAVVVRHGLGYCPTGWPTDSFQFTARHAAVRMAPADIAAAPAEGDTFSLDGLDYQVRIVRPVPQTGTDTLWIESLCAADQRGRY